MSQDADHEFYDRAHEHLRVANDHLSESPQQNVGASLTYACARFNAWLSASHRESPAELRKAYGETIEYFVAEYRRMLVKNLDDYLHNFDKYKAPAKAD